MTIGPSSRFSAHRGGNVECPAYPRENDQCTSYVLPASARPCAPPAPGPGGGRGPSGALEAVTPSSRPASGYWPSCRGRQGRWRSHHAGGGLEARGAAGLSPGSDARWQCAAPFAPASHAPWPAPTHDAAHLHGQWSQGGPLMIPAGSGWRATGRGTCVKESFHRNIIF